VREGLDMAVYTPLARGEIDAFLARYGLGPLREFRPIARGIENTNYQVSVPGGEYVLTVFERQSADTVEDTLRLTQELADRGVPCPRPVESAAGVVGSLRGKPAALVPFADGKPVWGPSEAHLESLGQAVARLHLAGADIPFGRPGPHLARVLVPLAQQLAGRLRNQGSALADLLREEAVYQASVPEEGFPSGVIHADLFLDNVLFDPKSSDVRALLDFHLAGRGPWVYDLAVVLLDAGWGGRAVVGDRARALLRGYRSARPVDGPEYRSFPDYLRRAALRFLCLRVERAFFDPAPKGAGSVKDPYEFAEKLRALRGG
jgi:homoserine kinase type II